MSLYGRAVCFRRVHRVTSAISIQRSSFSGAAKYVVQGYHAVPGLEPPPVSQIGIAHLNDQHFWMWGLSLKHIADLTGKPKKDVPQEICRQIGTALPVADLVHNLTSVPEEFLCPVCEELFTEPVVGPDGMCYELSAILECINLDGLSPISGETIDESQLFPAADTLMEVLKFRRQSVENIVDYIPVLVSCKHAEAAAAILDYAELLALREEDQIQIAECKKQLDEAVHSTFDLKLSPASSE